MYRMMMFILSLFCYSLSPLLGMERALNSIFERRRQLEEEVSKLFKNSIPVVYDGAPLKINIEDATIETEFNLQESARITLINDFLFWEFVFRASHADTFQTIDIKNRNSDARYEILFKDEECKKNFDAAFCLARYEFKIMRKLACVIKVLDRLNNLSEHERTHSIKINSSVLHLDW